MTSKPTDKLLGKLARKEYREAFVEAEIENLIPFQILAMRKKLGWNQHQLAKAAGMSQGRISLLENADYEGSHNIKTLLRIAAACDVGLMVRFAPFSELLEWSSNLSPENHSVPDYQTEVARCKQPTELEELASRPVLSAEVSGSSGGTANVVQFPRKQKYG